MGPECGSWGVPARGTSMRNFMNWAGAMALAFVTNANMTVSRKHGYITYSFLFQQRLSNPENLIVINWLILLLDSRFP